MWRCVFFFFFNSILCIIAETLFKNPLSSWMFVIPTVTAQLVLLLRLARAPWTWNAGNTRFPVFFRQFWTINENHDQEEKNKKSTSHMPSVNPNRKQNSVANLAKFWLTPITWSERALLTTYTIPRIFFSTHQHVREKSFATKMKSNGLKMKNKKDQLYFLSCCNTQCKVRIHLIPQRALNTSFMIGY